MLFKLVHWYYSQKIISQNIMKEINKMSLSQDTQSLILDFIFCKNCKTFYGKDNCCCCNILNEIREN